MQNFEFLAEKLIIKYKNYYAECETKEIFDIIQYIISTDHEIAIDLPEIHFKSPVMHHSFSLTFKTDKLEIEILEEKVRELEAVNKKLEEKMQTLLTKFAQFKKVFVKIMLGQENKNYVLLNETGKTVITDWFARRYMNYNIMHYLQITIEDDHIQVVDLMNEKPTYLKFAFYIAVHDGKKYFVYPKLKF